MSGFSSIFSFAIVTLSPSSPEISSSAGAIIRHGPHHSAQKSTRTGLSEPRTSEAKLWSVTVLVAMAGESPGGVEKLTSIWGLPSPPSRDELHQLGGRRVKESRAYAATRKDHLQGFGIGVHLCAMSIGNLGLGRGNLASLEVDDRHAILLNEQPVDRACDHSPVGERR